MMDNLVSMSKVLRGVTRQDRGQDANLSLESACNSCTLTRLLMDATAATDARTLLVLCCSADARDREEAVPTLKFGEEVLKQKMKPTPSATEENMPPEPAMTASTADVREEIRSLMGKFRLKKENVPSKNVEERRSVSKKPQLPARERSNAAKRRSQAREKLRNALFEPLRSSSESANGTDKPNARDEKSGTKGSAIKKYFESKNWPVKYPQ